MAKISYSSEDITILKGLEIDVLKQEGDLLSLSVPSYRVDVQRDVDVIEDILRIYGYDNVEAGSSLKSSIAYSVNPNSVKLQELASKLKTQYGTETLALSFDVRCCNEVEQFLGNLPKQWQCIDILINNVGISEFSLFTDISDDLITHDRQSVAKERKWLKPVAITASAFTAIAACSASTNIVKNRANSWNTGFPGGCPTSSLYDEAMNSPQSQKEAVGSMVRR